MSCFAFCCTRQTIQPWERRPTGWQTDRWMETTKNVISLLRVSYMVHKNIVCDSEIMMSCIMIFLFMSYDITCMNELSDWPPAQLKQKMYWKIASLCQLSWCKCIFLQWQSQCFVVMLCQASAQGIEVSWNHYLSFKVLSQWLNRFPVTYLIYIYLSDIWTTVLWYICLHPSMLKEGFQTCITY